MAVSFHSSPPFRSLKTDRALFSAPPPPVELPPIDVAAAPSPGRRCLPSSSPTTLGGGESFLPPPPARLGSSSTPHCRPKNPKPIDPISPASSSSSSGRLACHCHGLAGAIEGSRRRRSRRPSPPASSVGSSPAFPPGNTPRRSERPPPFLGLAVYDGFYPAGVAEPHPSAKSAKALARKADFEYDFVPWVPEEEAWGWFPLDARDGRVLIQSKYFPDGGSGEFPDGGDSARPRFMNYAVCDPLFKRYVLLPPIPDHLTFNQGTLVNFGLCLAPSQEDEVDTSFRVICLARYETKLVVFVFSSVTRRWGIATSSNWTSLGTENPPSIIKPKFYGLGLFDYVDGCFYWTVPLPDKILVLDALKMELSVINYAHRVEDGCRACIAVDREGTPGMLTVGEYLGNREFRLSRIAKESDHESPNERLSENIIQLPSYHNEYFTLGAAEGFIFLRGFPEDDQDEEDPDWEPEEVNYYSLNVRSAEFERVCAMDPDKCYDRVCPYFRFPPPSAKPCV